MGRKYSAVGKSEALKLIDAGFVPAGKHDGKKFAELTDGELGFIIVSLIDPNRKGQPWETDLINALQAEQRRRNTPRNVPAANETSEPIVGSGVILWGHTRGQKIADQSDEALRGAIWAAERGKGGPEYLAELTAERDRRSALVTA